MRIKYSLQTTVLAVVLLVSGQSAYARSAYVTPLNQAMVTTGLSCNACHTGGANAGNANQPLVAAWSSRATTPMVTVDSDNDGNGNTNGIEVRMGTDFNVATDFTAGAAANGVFVSTASSVTTAAATDLSVETNSTFALTGSDTILSGKSITPTLPTAGFVSLALEDANILTAKVYEVIAGTATEITQVTINTTGSISFTTKGAQPKLLVVGTTSTATTTPQGEASVYGCISATLPMPAVMFLAMITLGLLVKRKQG